MSKVQREKVCLAGPPAGSWSDHRKGAGVQPNLTLSHLSLTSETVCSLLYSSGVTLSIWCASIRVPLGACLVASGVYCPIGVWCERVGAQGG